MDKAELMGEMLKQADADKTQARVELAQALEELARLKEYHQHMLDGPLTTAQRECHQAREEIARLKAVHNSITRYKQMADSVTEADQARAERDAAVGAVHELITAGRDAYDNGYPEMERAVCEARAALASLPHAAARAQAVRDVVAAARDAMAQIHDQRTLWPAEVDTLDDAIKRLDALERGGGE